MRAELAKQPLIFALKTLLVTLIIHLSGRFGLMFAVDPVGVSLVSPQTGVALAALILIGTPILPAIFAGMVLVNLADGMSLLTALAVAGGSTLAVLVAALLLRAARFQPAMRRVQNILAFLGFGVVVSASISATIGVYSLYLMGGLTGSIDLRTWITWWLGDGMGILVVAPVVLVWFDRGTHDAISKRRLEVVGTLSLFVVVTWIIFNRGASPLSFYPLAYLIFPFLVWGALRFAHRIVTLQILLVAALAVVATLIQIDSYPPQTLWNNLLFMWSYIATLAITMLLLSATLTERREIERKFSAVEERFTKSFHSAPAAIAITTIEDSRLIDVNAAFCQLFGYTREEVIGRTTDELRLWYEPAEQQRILERVRQQDRVLNYETRLRKKSGEICHGLFALEQIDLQGKPHLLGMFQDVTARLQAELALRESERRYRQLFEGIGDAVFVHDFDGNILDVNEVSSTRLGYTRDELLKMKITDVDTPEFAKGFLTRLDHQVTAGQLTDIETKHVAKDGSEIMVDVNSKLITYEGKLAILALARDITARTLAEQALRESEARYRAVVEDQTEFIVRVALDWQIKFVNEAFCRYYGKSHDEMIDSYFKPHIYPDDFNLVRAALKSITPQQPVVTYEHRILRDDELRWQQWTVRGILGETGALHEYQFVGKDITDLKRIEEERLKLAVEHEKVAILADFIATASHDFRTPLSVINTSAYLLNRVQEPEQRDRYFENIQNQIHNIERLVEGLLTMARLDRGDIFRFQPHDLNSTVRQVEIAKRPHVERGAQTLTLDLAPDLPPVNADPEWLYRLVYQLVDNAILYTPEDGAITVVTRADDDRVLLEVRDTGIGISPEALPHIYDRLFRGKTHRPVGGQGLGLTIVRKIIEMHGGAITVETAVGIGSTFRVWLPATTDVPPPDTTAESSPSP